MARIPLAALAACATAAAACGGGSQLTISAASSLRQVLVQAAEAGGATADARVSFTGSQAGVAQVEAGAPIDVIITAGEPAMERLVAAQLVEDPVTIGRGRLAIVVGEGNPHGVRSLADLLRPDLIVVLAAPDVPAGAAAAQALDDADLDLEPAALERSAAGAVTRVATGAAHAGVAYASDGGVGGVDVIPIEGAPSVPYLAAVVRDSDRRDDARSWVSAFASEAAHALLAAHGIEPALPVR